MATDTKFKAGKSVNPVVRPEGVRKIAKPRVPLESRVGDFDEKAAVLKGDTTAPTLCLERDVAQRERAVVFVGPFEDADTVVAREAADRGLTVGQFEPLIEQMFIFRAPKDGGVS